MIEPKTPTGDYEGWLRGMLGKRTPDAVCVLGDLLEAGLKRGECSAKDVRDRSFSQPNVIGGVFRLLPRMGFICNYARREKMTDKKKHSRSVPVWELKEAWRAQTALQKIQRNLLFCGKETNQYALQI